ncbi:type VI secretion system protein TssA [Roseateles sp. BYS180W]|uniref:Type VI secretion system protein TssA n=1 Tax=Roseateles rivi TaxID=3299028 RepID=A0ABW7FSY7_9BURK
MIKLPSWLSGERPSLPKIPESHWHPIQDHAPCGPSLEYDHDFAVLQSRLRPRAEVQYGQFIQAASGPDWGEIEREALALLQRSRDLQVLLWFTRSRTLRAGAPGLLEGLQWMVALLQHWPDDVHPQLFIDGERDPAVRANVLAGLADPEGLLGDLRQLEVASGSGLRLTLRDIERALAKTRAADAPSPEAVRQQLRHLHDKRDSTLLTLQACALAVAELQTLCQRQLGSDAPNLQPLTQLLQSLEPPAAVVAAPRSSTAAPPAPAPDPMPPQTLQALPPTHATSVNAQREQVRLALRAARQWIEEHEPSSPVAVLLKQAERMWGKRFSEIAHAIPPDLLSQWDQD